MSDGASTRVSPAPEGFGSIAFASLRLGELLDDITTLGLGAPGVGVAELASVVVEALVELFEGVIIPVFSFPSLLCLGISMAPGEATSDGAWGATAGHTTATAHI